MDTTGAMGKKATDKCDVVEELKTSAISLRKNLAEEKKTKKAEMFDWWDDIEFYTKNIKPKVDELNELLQSRNIPHLIHIIPRDNEEYSSIHKICFCDKKAGSTLPLVLCAKLLESPEKYKSEFLALMMAMM